MSTKILTSPFILFLTIFSILTIPSIESNTGSNSVLLDNRRFKHHYSSGIARKGLIFSTRKTNWGYPVGRNLDSGKNKSISRLLEVPSVLISGNLTFFSQNRTFELGFFSNNGGTNWYFGIWYGSIPIRTYVWVANRENPVRDVRAATVRLTERGRLRVAESGGFSVWETENVKRGVEAKLLDSGNLVLLSLEGEIVWQSFDFPADTWLPGMNITRYQSVTCWRSALDPSPGNYSLRLKQPEFGEFELVYNDEELYWSTGNWTGNAFASVPEMTVPYIYLFRFVNPFTPAASFGYDEMVFSPEDGGPPLTRFVVDSYGMLKQYTWSSQTENWNMFWFRPENDCHVYGLCGNLGYCGGGHSARPCECLSGFRPVDVLAWESGDFTSGCRPIGESLCDGNDGFEEVGRVSFDAPFNISVSASRSVCEQLCLKNCSCVGININEKNDVCMNLYGSMLNLRNMTGDSTEEKILYFRVGRGVGSKKNKWRRNVILIGGVCGVLVVLGFVVLLLLGLRKKRERGKKKEDNVFPATNLKVFSYKELYGATRGFKEEIGHGGFGVVFRGELSDLTKVAIKRLERPGGGEKEFRAEVCTIGNIQHVNLVHLRGFCSENSHRMLVYDYMPNGSLSMFIQRDGQSSQTHLSWDVRFRVAVGTARGLAYLHEACRDCIIHCDIKPENILLDDEFTAKVSDFGMAKLIGRDFSRVLTTMRGTLGYVAPEWLSGVAITAKADVYSYGMTLLEIIGGRRNVETTPPSATKEVAEKWFFPPWAARQVIEGNVAGVVDDRLVGQYNFVEAERMAMVAVWCIQDDESVRPTMSMVVKMLEGTVEVTVPPPPQLLQALVSGDSFRGVGNVSGQDSSTGAVCSDESNHVSGVSSSSAHKA
ncbi:hypothetical protein GIB67_008357 [Kingdonia uniflora]|uniref:Receptor-like serine/threonine-protein kinase n=1 Tax=Kingdonia uniflora TaxID=39325 RepID=A0A7J7N5P0_9MAGN|nr:hypothetical protein GIB67_008357 [Kingdonia uniflora]